ncbi:hypothetical protein BDV93DRAFT_517422 [Ceratobasidium sp. AG-I]|nr:hypothetical protein BDV93DRAFT_517422 [Ceratobasidium sp. AG-I]
MAVKFQLQAYNAFVSVLGKDISASPTIPREQLLGGIAYYLVELPPNYVQTFVTLTLASPALWGTSPRSSTLENIHSAAWGVMQATQQAVVAKHAAILADPTKSSILPPLGRQRVALAFNEWLDLVISGSHCRTEAKNSSIPRLAFLGGLVLGLQDLQTKEVHIPNKASSRSCAELVVSVAECLDQYVAFDSKAIPMPTWDPELAFRARVTEPHLDIVVQICATTLHHVSSEQLEALDLSKLACVCFGSVLNVFQNGHCYDALSSELHKLDSGLLGFKAQSKLPQKVQSIHNSPAYVRLGSVTKFMGHLLVSMAQSKFWQPRLYPILGVYIDGLCQMSLNMENSWSQSALSLIQDDGNLDAMARPTTTNIWHGLKSLLFSTVLTIQSVLDVTIYYSAVSVQEGKLLSRNILMTFCRMSFISARFGALAAEGGGFTEMKRAFFGALDVLSSNSDDQDTTGDRLCSKLINDLATELADVERSLGTAHPIYQGRIIYFLVCTEHVMSQLEEETITRAVLPVVLTHLSDTHNREKYEAAHSTMLAIFAASEATSLGRSGNATFNRAQLLVPAYIRILLQNSGTEKLSTDQLCLAFQALVRNASSSNDELSWLCIEELKVAINELSATSDSKDSELNERILRLQLALISAIPAAPISKLLPLLAIVYDQILHSASSKDKLVKATYHEIIERLGDREKDIALKWWLKSNPDFEIVR